MDSSGIKEEAPGCINLFLHSRKTERPEVVKTGTDPELSLQELEMLLDNKEH